MNHIEFNKSLNQQFNYSKFSAEIGETGGFLVFSNSGQRGLKYFTLSLHSLASIFEDIKSNLTIFSKHQNYVEGEWRDLGSKYYTDETANALCTVQTKPLFSTVSKIINLANDLDGDPDNDINIDEGTIDNALGLLNSLMSEFAPKVIKKLPRSNPTENFKVRDFTESLATSKLIIPNSLPLRFTAALQTKPFVILTGLSGSGKTKLAEAFSLWICESSQQYCMVAVGADWTNREPLLGFPNALDEGGYIKPDSGVLDLILRAVADPDRPYFLILDEMNMSHVERYFADFLSAMESNDSHITLHPEGAQWERCDVPATLSLPKNLFVIGTVNIDETTYMFSPKVLDRANVIEFRVSKDEMSDYFENPKPVDMERLRGSGASMAESFVAGASNNAQFAEKLGETLMPFFKKLQGVGAEFGYRTASEISQFVAICTRLSESTMSFDEVVDAAIIQKLLPKLHGSRNKIEKVLQALGSLCLNDPAQDPFQSNGADSIKYPLSYEKLQRMHNRVLADGFTSFAEA
jgi:5-methylcytosine-specific restriction protein B